MNAHKIETVLTEDGTLTLRGLPFHAGDTVEVIILESRTQQHEALTHSPNSNPYPLRGTVIRYDDPTEPVALEAWEALN
jgi:hypothetical protein